MTHDTMFFMGYPSSLLAPGEVIKVEIRPHWRAIIVPAVIFLATVVALVLVLDWVASAMSGAQWLRWLIIAGGVVVVVLWAAIPFLRWITTQYVFTDRRIIVRSGIVTRQGKDMPLSKINNVSFHVPAMGRILNYGELLIQSAGENDGLTIEDVPDVEQIQRDVYEYIEADEARRRGMGPSAD